tara:strand:- start:560 stop:1033 length:474 start_codon:yes stop_codon:yes gene_type:complete
MSEVSFSVLDIKNKVFKYSSYGNVFGKESAKGDFIKIEFPSSDTIFILSKSVAFKSLFIKNYVDHNKKLKDEILTNIVIDPNHNDLDLYIRPHELKYIYEILIGKRNEIYTHEKKNFLYIDIWKIVDYLQIDLPISEELSKYIKQLGEEEEEEEEEE